MREAIHKCKDQRLWKDALQLLDDLGLEGQSAALDLTPKVARAATCHATFEEHKKIQ